MLKIKYKKLMISNVTEKKYDLNLNEDKSICLIDDQIVYLIIKKGSYENTLIFDKSSKIPNFTQSDLLKMPAINDINSMIYFMMEIAETLEYISDKVIEFIKNNITKLLKIRPASRLLAYIVFEPKVLEKMLNTFSNKMILEKLNEETITSDNGKIKKTFGYSPEVIKKANRFGNTTLLKNLEPLNKIDPNYVTALIDIIDAYYKLDIKFTNMQKMKDANFRYIVKNILYLLEKGYTFKPLMNYLMRQSIFYYEFSFIDEILITLVDYVSMASVYSKKFEKYPKLLKKSHYILGRNLKVLDNKVLVNQFNKKVAELKTYEVIDKKEDYSLIAPTDANDLAREGSLLNHCVVNYMEAIANGEKIVLFLRKNNDLKTPFVTVEINKSKTLIQAKQNFNEDVESQTLNQIKKLLKK